MGPVRNIPYLKASKFARLLVPDQIVLSIKIFFNHLDGTTFRPPVAGDMLNNFGLIGVGNIQDRRPVRFDLPGQRVIFLSSMVTHIGIAFLQNDLKGLTAMKITVAYKPDIERLCGVSLVLNQNHGIGQNQKTK